MQVGPGDLNGWADVGTCAHVAAFSALRHPAPPHQLLGISCGADYIKLRL